MNASYDLMGENLMKNFMRITYEKEFPDQESIKALFEELRPLSFNELLARVEEYAYMDYSGDDDDDDDDDEEEIYEGEHNGSRSLYYDENYEYSLGEAHGPSKDVYLRRAYMGVSLLIWKSKTFEELCTAMDSLESVQVDLEDRIDERQWEFLMPEFHRGVEMAFQRFLWKMTCDAAFYNREELEKKIEEEKKEKQPVDVLQTLRHDICAYMSATDKKTKETAMEELYWTCDDILYRDPDENDGDKDSKTKA